MVGHSEAIAALAADLYLDKLRAHHAGQSEPKPKFRIGQKVVNKSWKADGLPGATGTISHVGEYDPYLGCYRYKVTRRGFDKRITWNETSLRAAPRPRR
jgi:hypothetical protein